MGERIALARSEHHIRGRFLSLTRTLQSRQSPTATFSTSRSRPIAPLAEYLRALVPRLHGTGRNENSMQVESRRTFGLQGAQGMDLFPQMKSPSEERIAKPTSTAPQIAKIYGRADIRERPLEY